MEAILKFDLNDEDDRIEHAKMLKAQDMEVCLWTIDDNFRKLMKYNQGNVSDEFLQGWDHAREMFISALADCKIELY